MKRTKKMRQARKETKKIGQKQEEFEGFVSGHNACAGCGAAIAMRHIAKAAGENSIISIATGCMEVVSTSYPLTAWKLPLIHSAFENAAATASGIDAALKYLHKKANVIAIAGDGGTFDIGFQALSGAIERNHNFLFICYDNEAYMNCLSTSSLILTKEGLKKITEVRLGEEVYAFDQKSHNLILKKCTGVFNNGAKKVFELETLHHSIKATGNHPFLVLQRNGRGKENCLIWKTLENIKKGDEIIALKSIGEGKPFDFRDFKRVKKGDYKVNKINEINLPLKSSPQLMKYLGIYVGDGWVRRERGEAGFALPQSSNERKILIKLHSEIFGSKIREDKDYVYVNSVNLANFINSLEFGKGAKNKTIPAWIFTLPKEEKESFIEGLMLSDGYKIGKSNRYVSASFELLRKLRLLLQTMDYRVGKIHKQKKLKGEHCVYRELLNDSEYGYICFSKRDEWNVRKYLNQYKYQNFFIRNNYFETEKITSIKSAGIEPTLDLRVEGEHNFIADGIVVHNTGVQRSGSTPRFTETTTSPYGKFLHGKVEWKKQLPFILAAHGCYVATASIAFLHDFQTKIKKALAMPGPKFISVLAPCTIGWKIQNNDAIEISRLAVQTGIFPLYEVENGIVKLNFDIKNKPVSEYLKRQGRFKHLMDREIREVQKRVDEIYGRIKNLSNLQIKIF